jgi:disulfide bond formation protein DsbB
MYPLVLIFLVALFPLDRKVFRYGLPIAAIGWGFAVYHYLLYMGFIPEELKPCGEGASCSEVNLEMLGFITIPMLSILSYTAIIGLLIIFRFRTQP